MLDKSVKIRVIFDVRSERRKVDNKANLRENWNMQTLFKSLLNILPNIIKIDLYNFELHCFKLGSIFETQCTVLRVVVSDRIYRGYRLSVACDRADHYQTILINIITIRLSDYVLNSLLYLSL